MSYLEGFYHLVWTTKNREPSIDEAREQLLARSFRDTCAEKKWELHAFGIMPDHIHLAMFFSTRYAIADVVKALKINSSHLLGRMTDGPSRIEFQWQTEYGAFLFHNERFTEVISYVLNQREHHFSNTLWAELERVERPR